MKLYCSLGLSLGSSCAEKIINTKGPDAHVWLYLRIPDVLCTGLTQNREFREKKKRKIYDARAMVRQ